RFCRGASVTRGRLARCRRHCRAHEGSSALFSDTAQSVFEADISALADAGITRGCNPPDNTRFCPEEFVTRGQMATFLYRGLAAGHATSEDVADEEGGRNDRDGQGGPPEDERGDPE